LGGAWTWGGRCARPPATLWDPAGVGRPGIERLACAALARGGGPVSGLSVDSDWCDVSGTRFGVLADWVGRGPGVVAALDPRRPSGTPLGSVVAWAWDPFAGVV
jgi:hypothetical protein